MINLPLTACPYTQPDGRGLFVVAGQNLAARAIPTPTRSQGLLPRDWDRPGHQPIGGPGSAQCQQLWKGLK